MRISVLAYGKLKTGGFRASADHYQHMIKRWCQSEEIEISPKRHGKLKDVLAKSKPQKKVLFLDNSGTNWSTREWASSLESFEKKGPSHLFLVLGNSDGFLPEQRKLADDFISLGNQTLSHELARVVLWEQLYRAFSLLRGHPYHRD